MPFRPQRIWQAEFDGVRLTLGDQGEMPAMALYEMRTYTLHVGKMAEAVKLYQELGFPALQKGGHDKKLVGFFQSDTGMINQLVHLWKFEDDADRRAHWNAVFANTDFVGGFAEQIPPAGDDARGEATACRAVGAASLTEPAPAWTRTSRIIKARPEALYAAFMDPAALVEWLPPAEMTGRIHTFDARVGGGYRMSLFYPPNEGSSRGKTSDREDMVNVRFVELEPPRKIVEAVSFVTADPALLWRDDDRW